MYENAEVSLSDNIRNEEIHKERAQVFYAKPPSPMTPESIAQKPIKLQETSSPQFSKERDNGLLENDTKSDTWSFYEDYGDELDISPPSNKIELDNLEEHLNKLGKCDGFQDEYKV